MKNRDGKITISSIIVMIFLAYGGFLAVKFIAASLTAQQINREIKSALYIRQGSAFTAEEGRQVIIDILKKSDVLFDEETPDAIYVSIHPETQKVKYYAEYDIEIDLLLFKRIKEVTLDKEISR